jgi:hypothetical protein
MAQQLRHGMGCCQIVYKATIQSPSVQSHLDMRKWFYPKATLFEGGFGLHAAMFINISSQI